MRVTLEFEMLDIPGQLVRVLEPIAEYGGNIISIVHTRDRSTPTKRVPVRITFEIDRSKLESVIKELKNRNVTIVRFGEQRMLEKTTVLLIGHIVHTDLSDTIDKIDSLGYAEVIDLQLSMPEVNYPSAALLTISAVGKEEMEKAIEELKKIGERKKILVVEPVEG